MATQKIKPRKTGTIIGAALGFLGLAGLAGMEQVAGASVCFLSIPLKMALETLPLLLLTAWHVLQPCALGHLRLLEGLLQISVSWQFVLTLTGL